MGTKTISIKEEVYNKLKARQYPNESFSEELNRILGEQKKSILDFAGSWAHLSEKELEHIKKTILEDRDNDTDRDKGNMVSIK
jgi:predicted CopG family antitoxin